MSSISKTDHRTERSIPALISAYQEYRMTFKVIRGAFLVLRVKSIYSEKNAYLINCYNDFLFLNSLLFTIPGIPDNPGTPCILVPVSYSKSFCFLTF